MRAVVVRSGQASLMDLDMVCRLNQAAVLEGSVQPLVVVAAVDTELEAEVEKGKMRKRLAEFRKAIGEGKEP
jgi:hypothetical protein